MGMIVQGMRRWGLVAFLLCLTASGSLLLGSVGPSFAQSGQMRVDVEGNRRVEADTIRSYIRIGPNERLDAAKLDSALKALYETGLFQDVRITPSNGRILVTVVENPVINRVAFEGNHKAKDEQLSSEIQSKPRGTFSRAQVQSDVQRIIEIYQRGGRYDVRVDPKIIELPNGRVDLIFEISEGVKTGVAAINFVGNKTYSDYRLKDVIKTGVTDWFSFLKTGDIYDPDRLEADRDLLRRFYLKNGFADVRIVSATGEYDPEKKGFVIVFTIDEGEQYHFGTVNIQSGVPAVPGETLRSKLRIDSGRVFNADAIEKSVEDMTIEMARRGYPFAAVRPRADRNFEARTVNLAFMIEEGPHTYIERINIRGNTRTRDYVIRREFDIVEGDAYNRALVDRAERRIKNLGFFKTVKITTEPGSAPDRIIINCDIEEQSTGELSFAGGYSTSEGIIGEVSVAERNLLGRGQQGKISVQYGEYAKGVNLSFVEPYFLDYRLALGLDAFAKQTLPTTYLSYGSTVIGGDVKFGVPIMENISTQLRVTGYQQQINLPANLNNCNNINPDFVNTFPTPDMSPLADAFGNVGNPTGNISTAYKNFQAANPGVTPAEPNCYADGEASLAARKELAAGAVFVSSLGYTLSYNTLDNNRAPSNGLIVELKQDLAGAPGDVNFVKTTLDARLYDEIFPDIVALVRGQGGYATGWGGDGLRMLDHFQAGPNMVRGFAPSGFGPRDVTQLQYGYAEADALGGSMYWASSLEVQTPIPYLPKDFGMKIAAFADAGQLTNYVGPTSWMNQTMTVAQDDLIRTSVGLGLIWDSPFGPLRFDFAYALTKEPYDHTQIFRFGGGTRF
jgi:outer membrane protein insertion porin family